MPQKRKSGGARAVEAKNKRLAAAREREGFDAEALKRRYSRLGKPPKDARLVHDWFASVAAALCHEAVHDFALAPEDRRRSAMQLIRWAIDTLDGAKLRAELKELYDAVKEGRKDDAARLASRDGGISPSATGIQ